MIRHIVMWKLKESAEGASRAENAVRLKEKLEGCRNIVPGILHLEVGLAGGGLGLARLDLSSVCGRCQRNEGTQNQSKYFHDAHCKTSGPSS